MAVLTTLAPPEGFVLDQPESAPAPPDGFQLDTPQSAAVRLPLAFYMGAVDHPIWKAMPELPNLDAFGPFGAVGSNLASATDQRMKSLWKDYQQGTVPEAIARGLGTAAADLPFLAASGGAVKAAGIGRLAADAIPNVLRSRVSWLPWLANVTAHGSATFGLKDLAESVVQGVEEGHLDPAEIVQKTAKGLAFGAATGPMNFPDSLAGRIAMHAVGGAALSKTEGGGPADMTYNAVLFSAFALMNGTGPNMARRVEAFRSAEQATADYIMAREPGVTREAAVSRFRRAVAGDLLKAGVVPTDEALTEAIANTPAKRTEEIVARIRGLTPEGPISTEPPLPATPALAKPPPTPEAPVVPPAQPGAQAATPQGAMPSAERTERIFRIGGPKTMTKFGPAGELSDTDLRRLTEEVNPPSDISLVPGELSPPQAQISPSLAAEKPSEISLAAQATGIPGEKLPKIPKSLISAIKARGGLDPQQVGKDYNIAEDFKQFGLLSTLKKGGVGLDDMAASLQADGLLHVPDDRTPGDYLLEVLKDKQKRLIKTAEELESQFEKEYAVQQQEDAHAGFTPAEIASSNAEADRRAQEEAQSELAQEGVELTPSATEFDPAKLEAPPSETPPILPDKTITISGIKVSLSELFSGGTGHGKAVSVKPDTANFSKVTFQDGFVVTMRNDQIPAEAPPVQQQVPSTEPALPPGGITPPVLFQEGMGPLFEQPQAQEPWQMTVEERKAEVERLKKENASILATPLMSEGSISPFQVGAMGRQQRRRWEKNVSLKMDVESRIKTLESDERIASLKAKSEEESRLAKERSPYRWTKDEWIKKALATKPQSLSHLNEKEYAKFESRRHLNSVKAALATGKPVPPEVLADYPDLQPATPTAKTFGRTPAEALAHHQANIKDSEETIVRLEKQLAGMAKNAPGRQYLHERIASEKHGIVIFKRYIAEIPPESLTGELPPGTLVAEGKDDVGALPDRTGTTVRSVQPPGPRGPSPYRAAARSLRVRFVQTGTLPLIDTPITSPEDVAFIFWELTHQAQENVFVLAVKNGRALGAVHASIGSLSASLVHPLQVLTLPMQRKADAVWIVHNHPSGNPQPSDEDVKLTTRFAEMLAALPTQITLRGHIVIEGGKFGFVDASGMVTTPPTAPRASVGTLPVFRTEQYRSASRLAPPIESAATVAAYLKSIVDPSQPIMTMLALDTRHNLVGHFPLPDVREINGLAREIIRRLTLVNAQKLILAATPERMPSEESLTRLSLTLKTYSMAMLDALVMTPEGELHRPAGVIEQTGAVSRAFLPTGRVAEEAADYNVEIPLEPDGPDDEVPTIKLGGMDQIKPLELPELVRLHREISPAGLAPGLKKFPRMLGRSPYKGGQSKVHPWLFLDQKAVDALRAEVSKYIDPDTGDMNLHAPGTPPPELMKKWGWVKRNWSPDLAIKVLAHEIGHLIDWLPDETTKRGNAIGHAISAVSRFMKESFGDLSNRQLRKELKALTQYWKPFEEVKGHYLDYRYSAVELYADFVSVLFNAPGKAKELAPTFYQAFFDYLDKKPDVKESFFQLQELLSGTTADLLESRAHDISTMFEKGEALFRARRLQAVQAQRSLLFRFKYLFSDVNIALLEKRAEAAKTHAIRPNEDPKYLIEQMNMVGSKVHADMMQFQPIYEELQKAGLDFSDDFGQYLFLKRVAGERSGLANPLGHTEKTAEQQLAFLKEQLGETKFALLEQAVGKMRAWFKAGNQQLFEAGLLTPEQFEAIQANDEYAPFRVLAHWKEWVSAGIIRQTGTLGEVGNPATAMVLKRVAMVRAAERNRITRDVMGWLLANDADTTQAKVIHYPEGVLPHVQPKEDREAVMWRERGEWKAAYVDPYIAESFRRDRPEDIDAIGKLIGRVTLNQTFFRPLYITYNLGFQSFNLVRDFLRYWKNTPSMTMTKAVRSYLTARPHAVARVEHTLDPVIEQMEREGALNPTFNTMILGQTNEDAEIEAILQRYSILEGKPTAPRVLLPIIRIMDAIQTMGDIIETIPKVAGWMEMQDLPAEERAYRVRNLVGTPNYKRRGRATPITNNLFLFSNIWKEGLRSDYEAAFTDPTTRAGWWWKTAKVGLLPKLLMAAVAAGLFGLKMKEGMDSATEYDKTNYTILPIGTDEATGKAIYLRIPLDETTRYLSAIFWKAISGGDWSDIFTYTAGQIPSAAPLLTILGAWGGLSKGQNPRDSFRGRDILTDDELKAGGVDAVVPMLKWTANQTGMVKLDLHDRLKDQSLLEKVVSLTPVINRWVRVTDYGRTEELRKAAEPAAKLEAQTRIERRRQEREGLASGQSREQVLDALQLVGKDRKVSDKRMSREQLTMADPVANALKSAYGSTEQQIAIMEQARSSYDTPAGFEEAVQTYKQLGLLTRKAKSALAPNAGAGPQPYGPPVERGKRRPVPVVP